MRLPWADLISWGDLAPVRHAKLRYNLYYPDDPGVFAPMGAHIRIRMADREKVAVEYDGMSAVCSLATLHLGGKVEMFYRKGIFNGQAI